jgi:hypothetical protein
MCAQKLGNGVGQVVVVPVRTRGLLPLLSHSRPHSNRHNHARVVQAVKGGTMGALRDG